MKKRINFKTFWFNISATIEVVDHGRFEITTLNKNCGQGWADCDLLLYSLKPEKTLSREQEIYVFKLKAKGLYARLKGRFYGTNS
jgi:hypothetical protein